ncbi:MAG: RNA polymerase sigma factor [Candidatus Cryptobacteroides sp.]
MDNPEYRSLIEGCIKGDRAAQCKLYNSLAPKMFALCIRYLGDKEAAEDILQEGFIMLFEKLGSFSETGSFEGWARKIFVNTALMSLRKNDALKMSDNIESARNVESGQPSVIQSLGYKELMHLVMSLPAGYRTVFNMFVIEGFSHNDIAAALGISPATSRSQLNRARQMLQEMIKNEQDAREL